MTYSVLSPWAEMDAKPKGINPRVNDLEGKTIGMLYLFIDSNVYLLKEIERQLKQKFPKTNFSCYRFFQNVPQRPCLWSSHCKQGRG